MALNNCSICLNKQRRIDQLEDEVKSLRAALGREQRKLEDGFFGSSTPSSKQPFKKNLEPEAPKPKGARPGHEGYGRKGHEQGSEDRIEEVLPESETCPQCGEPLSKKGVEQRSVVDIPLVKPEKIVFNLHRRYCSKCRKGFTPQPPGVLPKSLFGNRLVAKAINMHYVHGIPVERVCELLGIGSGSIAGIFQRVAGLFSDIPNKLIEEYRNSPVKHADETGWRTNGKNGYVWLFATDKLSIFQFGKNRSAQVPLSIFGKDSLPGTLVVDRYNAYNKVPCSIQYCYAHLLRDVEDLEKEFPDNSEVSTFTAVAIPLLSSAMNHPAHHLGIRRIQDIFIKNHDRLYHWSLNRSIPAENNLAERDLRPSVVARKVSFGSVSDAGAQTRSTLQTVACTLKKRGMDVERQISSTLDLLARDSTTDIVTVLFNPS